MFYFQIATPNITDQIVLPHAVLIVPIMSVTTLDTVLMDVRWEPMVTCVRINAVHVRQIVTEYRGNVLENVRLASSGHIVRKCAINCVPTDVGRATAYVTVVMIRNMEIIATRPVVLSASLPVINKVEAVSVYLDGRGQHVMVDIQNIFVS